MDEDTPPGLTYLRTITPAPTLGHAIGVEVYRRDREKPIQANGVLFGYTRALAVGVAEPEELPDVVCWLPLDATQIATEHARAMEAFMQDVRDV